MGVYFVYAGGMKIFVSGLDRFAGDLENYRMIEGDFAIVASYLLPWAEVVVGICFMLGILRRGAWLAMLGLVLAFTIAVGSAWWRGLDISCGCTGAATKISYWGKALEFGIYYLVLAFLAASFWKKHSPNQT
jgi:putative oxidoreductase